MKCRAKPSISRPEPRSSKPSSSSAAANGRSPGSPAAVVTVRIMAPNTSQSGGCVLCGTFRPRHARAADQPAVDKDRVRPVEGDHLLGRRMHEQRVGERRHPGIESAPREPQRLVRLHDQGELDQIEAADPYQRAGARLGCDPGRVRERIAHFAQHYEHGTTAEGRGLRRRACGCGFASRWPLHSGLSHLDCNNYRVGWPLASPARFGTGGSIGDMCGRAIANNPSVLVRGYDVARRRRCAPRLRRRECHERTAIVPRRARAGARRAERGRSRDGRLHPGGAAVRRACGRARRRRLCQHPRDRRLVERRQTGRAEDRGAARSRRRADAAARAGAAVERRRHPDLRPRRDRNRSRPAPGKSARRDGAVDGDRRTSHRRASPIFP